MKLTPLRFTFGLLIIALIAAMLFTQGSIGYSQNKDEANFCNNCHEMNPDIVTWQVSAHNNIGCIKCHSDLNFFDFWYRHWQDWFNTPIKAKTFIANETCEQCHSTNRTFTPPGDIIIPHDLHIAKQVDCIDCHSNVTHFNIADKLQEGISAEEMAAFDTADAEQLQVKGKFVTMNQCFHCHNGEKATDACSACHSTRNDKEAPSGKATKN